MLDIFKDTSFAESDSYPEDFWNNQVSVWSFRCEKEAFKWNMESWQNATQTS